MENNYYPFENVPLPYAFGDMEPLIDEKTMQLHYEKHLQAYIDNLNHLLQANPALQRYSLEQMVRGLPRRLPNDVGLSLRRFAGGVYNHRFYFDLLQNPAPEAPCGPLAEAIDRRFGSLDGFKDAFRKAALSVFGSGYAWLVLGRNGLGIVTTPNQNNPLARGLCPILTVDVWEHAYYLKHFGNRGDYLDNWFQIINWKQAEENYARCLVGSRRQE